MNDNELNYLETCLLDGVINVKFIKHDGSERLMRCTQDDKLIPKDHLDEDYIYPNRADIYKVFDLDINEWRAFKPSRVISWAPEI